MSVIYTDFLKSFIFAPLKWEQAAFFQFKEIVEMLKIF